MFFIIPKSSTWRIHSSILNFWTDKWTLHTEPFENLRGKSTIGNIYMLPLQPVESLLFYDFTVGSRITEMHLLMGRILSILPILETVIVQFSQALQLRYVWFRNMNNPKENLTEMRWILYVLFLIAELLYWRYPQDIRNAFAFY